MGVTADTNSLDCVIIEGLFMESIFESIMPGHVPGEVSIFQRCEGLGSRSPTNNAILLLIL